MKDKVKHDFMTGMLKGLVVLGLCISIRPSIAESSGCQSLCDKDLIGPKYKIDEYQIKFRLFTGDASVFICQSALINNPKCFPNEVKDQYESLIEKSTRELNGISFSALLSECYSSIKIPIKDPNLILSSGCGRESIEKLIRQSSDISKHVTRYGALSEDDLKEIFRFQNLPISSIGLFNSDINDLLKRINSNLRSEFQSLDRNLHNQTFISKEVKTINDFFANLGGRFFSCSKESILADNSIMVDCYDDAYSEFINFVSDPIHNVVLSSSKLSSKINTEMLNSYVSDHSVIGDAERNAIYEKLTENELREGLREISNNLRKAIKENETLILEENNQPSRNLRRKLKKIVNDYPFALGELVARNPADSNKICFVAKQVNISNEKIKKGISNLVDISGKALFLVMGGSLLRLGVEAVPATAFAFQKTLPRLIKESLYKTLSAASKSGAAVLMTSQATLTYKSHSGVRELELINFVNLTKNDGSILLDRALYRELLLARQLYYYEAGKLGLALPISAMGIKTIDGLKNTFRKIRPP
jgi:hypothetical protein